jgi:hypothetical protein
MTLIYGGISAEKVEILFPVNIPKINPFAPFQYYRQGMIIMRSMALF